jgi:hypothetical protein
MKKRIVFLFLALSICSASVEGQFTDFWGLQGGLQDGQNFGGLHLGGVSGYDDQLIRAYFKLDVSIAFDAPGEKPFSGTFTPFDLAQRPFFGLGVGMLLTPVSGGPNLKLAYGSFAEAELSQPIRRFRLALGYQNFKRRLTSTQFDGYTMPDGSELPNWWSRGDLYGQVQFLLSSRQYIGRGCFEDSWTSGSVIFARIGTPVKNPLDSSNPPTFTVGVQFRSANY